MSTSNAPDLQQQLKQRVAQAALKYLRDDMVLGVGTGSTVGCFIHVLASWPGRIRAAVSSSEASSRLLRALNIEVVDLNSVDTLELYVDGADQATRDRCLIKGGGGALTREKIIAAAAHQFVCMIDESKLVTKLGRFALPIEVIPMARAQVAKRIAAFGGRALWREATITDNGNHILDVLGLQIDNPVQLESELNQIVGVVAVGLFARRPADVLLVAAASGVRAL